MQITPRRLTWVVGLLLVAALTPDAHAQRRLLYDPPDPPAQAAPAVRVTLNRRGRKKLRKHRSFTAYAVLVVGTSRTVSPLQIGRPAPKRHRHGRR